MFTAFAAMIRQHLVGDVLDRLHADNAELRADNARLRDELIRTRARAGRPDATPQEAAMLALVTEAPGKLASVYAERMWRGDPDRSQPPGDVPWFVAMYAKPLTSLYRKGLVRRERAGQTFRYWPVEER